MSVNGPIEAVRFLRKLRGSSQPVLIEASDGLQYVLKFHCSQLGSNQLFNEAIGNRLFHLAGLSTPEWKVVRLSEEFIQANTACWFESEQCRHRPEAGMAFATFYLAGRNQRLFEILPGGYFSRVRNQCDFWLAWVLDILGGHTDNRQAIFLEADDRILDASFIDHGHFLGGDRGECTPVALASRYLDRRIYKSLSDREAASLQRRILAIDLTKLTEVFEQIPGAWKTESAIGRFKELLVRLNKPAQIRKAIRSAVQCENEIRGIEHYGEIHCGGRLQDAHLYSALPATGADVQNPGTGCSVCGPERRGVAFVQPPWLKAAGF